MEDFQSVKAEVVANLVDRLMEGVPNTLIPSLEAAAVVRWFDQPILRAMTGLEDVRDIYNELRHFPFVRTRAEGLALHDSVRELIDENLLVVDPERHCILHERAAAYFESRIGKVTGEGAERLGLERLYHCIRADEMQGIELFQKMAEELTRHRLVYSLRALLNDANTYLLELENSKLWREYYIARLAHLETRLTDIEKAYQTIGENQEAGAKLRAYALCDLGIFLSRWQILGQVSGTDKAIRTLEQALHIYPLDRKLAESLWALNITYSFLSDWNRALTYLEQARSFFENQGDVYGTLLTLDAIKSDYAIQGRWHEMLIIQKEALALVPPWLQVSFAKARLRGGWSAALVLTGRYSEAESNVRESLSILQKIGETDLGGYLRDLGFATGLQDKHEEAEHFFTRSVEVGEKYSSLTFWGATLFRHGEFAKAEQYL